MLDTGNFPGYIRSVTINRDDVNVRRYPFTIPALKTLEALPLHPAITFLVGENGSGKSTLVEAIAVAAGFNAEGGTKNFNFTTRDSTSSLSRAVRLVRNSRREKDGFFLRAESFFNVATNIEELDKEPGGPPIISYYGDISLHEQSHGESFMALAEHRFGGNGLYILDEPEAALSPKRQLSLLVIIDKLIKNNSQFIIATHSPILMAYPGATIYQLDKQGIKTVNYRDTEHYRLTLDFLQSGEVFLKKMFSQ